MGLVVITFLSGDGLEEAIERTELIFIIGMWSCSSLHRAFTFSAKSERPVSSFLAGVWSVWSEKGDKGSDYYFNITWMLLFVKSNANTTFQIFMDDQSFFFLLVWQ